MPRRPEPTEYAPYYETYVHLVTEEAAIGELLARQLDETLAVYRGVTDERALFRYAPGKWSIKQVIGHVADSERVFQYRAFSIARGEQQSLPGFDQDPYVVAGNFDARSWTSLLEELKAVRLSSVALFRNLDEAAIARQGTANNTPVTVRALGYIIAGHERHHLAQLKERYGVGR